MLDWMIKEPHRFDFFQVLKFIDQDQMVFKTNPSMCYPVSGIEAIHFDHETRIVEILINFFGLSGTKGTLPFHDKELIVKQDQLNDTALKDFIDLINHLLIKSMISSHKRNHIDFSLEFFLRDRSINSVHASVLSSFIGDFSFFKQNKNHAKQDFLLYFSSYFANNNKNIYSLKNIIEQYFKVEIEIQEFDFHKYYLNKTERLVLNQEVILSQLGISTILGVYIYDSQYHLRIILKNLTYSVFKGFLPNGSKKNIISALIRRYLIEDINIELELELQANEVPIVKLGYKKNFALGWNTWIASRPFEQDVRDVVVRLDDFDSCVKEISDFL